MTDSCAESWTWTDEAESLHRLSQADLWRDGIPVERVAVELVQALGGAQVIADSPIDAYWLETLYEAAAQPCPVAIQCVSEILPESGLKSDVIFDAQIRIDALGFGRHRAGEDARWLAALLMELEKQMQAKVQSLLQAPRPTEMLTYAAI